MRTGFPRTNETLTFTSKLAAQAHVAMLNFTVPFLHRVRFSIAHGRYYIEYFDNNNNYCGQVYK